MELRVPLRFHPVADGDDDVKAVELYRLIRICNVQKMYITFFIVYELCCKDKYKTEDTVRLSYT